MGGNISRQGEKSMFDATLMTALVDSPGNLGDKISYFGLKGLGSSPHLHASLDRGGCGSGVEGNTNK